MSSTLVNSSGSVYDQVSGLVMSDLRLGNHDDIHTQNARCNPPGLHDIPRLEVLC